MIKEAVIKLYTMDGCSYCDELKMLLKTSDVPFTEINIHAEENREKCAEIMQQLKCDSVPIITVNRLAITPNVGFKTIPQAAETIIGMYKMLTG